MNIHPKDLSINQLFSAKNEQFIVPSYQRRYAWKVAQTEALFDDIEMLKDGDGHLFGTLILHSETHTSGLNKPELIDGQQRITSLTILLKAIQEHFKSLGNDEKVDEIKNMLTCKDIDEVVQNKVLLGDLDNGDFSNIMKLSLNDIGNENLKNAYEDFHSWLDDYSEEELKRYYYKLINVAVIIRLDVGHAQDAYKLFETINNRGLRLSATDIIKNFLLGHAAKLGEMSRLDAVKDLWSKIIISLDGIDTDDFFRQYMCALLRKKVTNNSLVKEFKTHYLNHVLETDVLGEYEYFVDAKENDEEETVDENGENDDGEVGIVVKDTIEQFLEKVRLTSDIYAQIVCAEFDSKILNRHFINLKYILSKPSYIFLMHLMQMNIPEKDLIQILKTIETFMLRRHICEMRTGEHDFIFSKLVKLLDEPLDELVDNVYDSLEEDLPEDADFRLSFPKHSFKGILRDRAKYVLEQIEYYKTGDTGELSINLGKEVHLEHIIPEVIDTKKSKKEFGDWVSYLGKNAIVIHKKYVHYIGNMTLLAGSLNISASNNPFAKKKPCYKKSAITITKDLVKYRAYKFPRVDERGEELASIALKIWSF